LGVSTVLPAPFAARYIAGIVIVGAIAAAARRAHSLSWSGTLAAIGIGTISIAAGWSWGTLLIAFFVSSTLLSRIGESRKQTATMDIVAKGGERDAAQVFANGGVFALCALGALLMPSAVPAWRAVGAGALATSTADTWATEVGTLVGGIPRSIVTLARVPLGTSGGVTPAGTAAALAGSAFIAGITLALDWSGAVAWGAILGGFAGAIVDSLAGATVQARRGCSRCGTFTERLVHTCGATTFAAGGMQWLNNDAVNAVSTVVGGAIAGCVWLALAGGAGPRT
jgi:uncharacterized protein (TIGR00297 family)